MMAFPTSNLWCCDQHPGLQQVGGTALRENVAVKGPKLERSVCHVTGSTPSLVRCSPQMSKTVVLDG